ncbi:hypothetical protein MHYP_G00032520 [Metynnis hypsauchen]
MTGCRWSTCCPDPHMPPCFLRGHRNRSSPRKTSVGWRLPGKRKWGQTVIISVDLDSYTASAGAPPPFEAAPFHPWQWLSGTVTNGDEPGVRSGLPSLKKNIWNCGEFQLTSHTTQQEAHNMVLFETNCIHSEGICH